MKDNLNMIKSLLENIREETDEFTVDYLAFAALEYVNHIENESKNIKQD